MFMAGFLLADRRADNRFNNLKTVDDKLFDQHLKLLEEAEKGWDCGMSDQCWKNIADNIEAQTPEIKELREQRKNIVE